MVNNSGATLKKDWQTIFLTKLAETGNVSTSCRAAKIERSTAYRLRWSDETFKTAWDEALDIATGLLEDEAWRRAEQGWLEPVFQKGDKVGEVRKFSDTLLIFLLKAHNPKKYRENIDVTSGGKPLAFKVVFADDVKPLSDDTNGDGE